ncbi:MAG TPA: lytic transglycosylase domain-containing protein [Bryobacteraceae bacterium]|nr:lytic transglycosylase domain-containing protein [Bryobacteraceae bacterium]
MLLFFALTILLSAARVYAQDLSGNSTLTLQEQSIASQMSAISSNGAQQQAESIRLQSQSLQKQHGASYDDWGMQEASATTPSTPAKSAAKSMADSKPVPDIKPVSDATPAIAEGPKRGFYTVPWPASPDFVMPNVQVATTACDALGNSEIESLIKGASSKNKLDPSLLRAVMVQESGFRPCAISTAGAMGLMQIMPETANDLNLEDPFDPAANVDAGAKYLKQMLDRYHGNTALALAAYNAGPGRTDKAKGNIPQIPETIGYVASILSNIPLY